MSQQRFELPDIAQILGCFPRLGKVNCRFIQTLEKLLGVRSNEVADGGGIGGKCGATRRQIG